MDKQPKETNPAPNEEWITGRNAVAEAPVPAGRWTAYW